MYLCLNICYVIEFKSECVSVCVFVCSLLILKAAPVFARQQRTDHLNGCTCLIKLTAYFAIQSQMENVAVEKYQMFSSSTCNLYLY